MAENQSNLASVTITSTGLSDDIRKLLEEAAKSISEKGIACSYSDNNTDHAHIVALDADSPEGKIRLQQLRSNQVKFVICQERMVGKNIVSVAKPVDGAIMTDLLERVIIQLAPLLAERAAKAASAAKQAPVAKHPPVTEKPVTEKTETVKQQTAVSEMPVAKQNLDTKPTPPKTPAVQSAPPAPRPQASEGTANKTIFHLLYAAKTDQMVLRIQVNGHPCLLVNGTGKTIVTEANEEQKRAMLGVDASQIKVENIDLDDFPSCPSDTIRVIPLDGTLWEAGLMWRTNLLMGGCSYDQQVKLKAWPNFTRSSFFPVHMRLSATLAAHAMTLNELQQQTQVPMGEITCYFNAAYAVGLIDLDPTGATKAAANKSNMNDERRGLLSRLANRFGLA